MSSPAPPPKRYPEINFAPTTAETRKRFREWFDALSHSAAKRAEQARNEGDKEYAEFCMGKAVGLNEAAILLKDA